MKNLSRKPLAIALGAAFVLSGAAQASVFQATDLGGGYMVASAGDKHAEGKCGEGKCGEGKCGEAMFDKMDTNKDGNVSKAEFTAAHQAHDKKAAEGKCGEGKCGEGKCGGTTKK